MKKVNKKEFLKLAADKGITLKTQADYLGFLRALRLNGFSAKADDVRRWQNREFRADSAFFNSARQR